jgi:uncharacterized integral membrane protein
MKFMEWVRITGLVVIGVIVILLVLANRHTTEVNLLVWRGEIPIILLLPGLLLLGFLAGYLTRMILAGRLAAKKPAGVPAKIDKAETPRKIDQTDSPGEIEP